MATLSSPPTEQEHTPRATALGGVFIWGAVTLLLVGILAYLFIGYAGVGHFTDADATRVLERQKILQDRQAEDYKYLHDKPGWFKKDAGLIRVPIGEAMAMTLPALQANRPHPAYPIAQSPPQNSSAPTSPDKGAPGPKVPGKTNDTAPAASNPTVGQPSPSPAASPAASGSNAAPTPVPLNTPVSQAGPASANNSNNPGNPTVPGTKPEPAAAPSAPTNTSGAITATPAPAATGAQPAPLTRPPGQPTPEATASPASAAATPTPNPQAPGASPAGTP